MRTQVSMDWPVKIANAGLPIFSSFSEGGGSPWPRDLSGNGCGSKPVPKWNPGKWKHGPKSLDPSQSFTCFFGRFIC